MTSLQSKRAVETVARATAEAAGQARKSERSWWVQQLRKAVSDAEELHGRGTAVISGSIVEQLVHKRCGKNIP
jgi:hypothetical protein